MEALKREQKLKEENATMLDAGSMVQFTKSIKEINENQYKLLKEMDDAEKNFIGYLQRERKHQLLACDNKARDLIDQLRAEE